MSLSACSWASLLRLPCFVMLASMIARCPWRKLWWNTPPMVLLSLLPWRVVWQFCSRIWTESWKEIIGYKNYQNHPIPAAIHCNEPRKNSLPILFFWPETGWLDLTQLCQWNIPSSAWRQCYRHSQELTDLRPDLSSTTCETRRSTSSTFRLLADHLKNFLKKTKDFKVYFQAKEYERHPSRTDPESHSGEHLNHYYDSQVIGKYCEKQGKLHLACIAYERQLTALKEPAVSLRTLKAQPSQKLCLQLQPLQIYLWISSAASQVLSEQCPRKTARSLRRYFRVAQQELLVELLVFLGCMRVETSEQLRLEIHRLYSSSRRVFLTRYFI